MLKNNHLLWDSRKTWSWTSCLAILEVTGGKMSVFCICANAFLSEFDIAVRILKWKCGDILPDALLKRGNIAGVAREKIKAMTNWESLTALCEELSWSLLSVSWIGNTFANKRCATKRIPINKKKVTGYIVTCLMHNIVVTLLHRTTFETGRNQFMTL